MINFILGYLAATAVALIACGFELKKRERRSAALHMYIEDVQRQLDLLKRLVR